MVTARAYFPLVNVHTWFYARYGRTSLPAVAGKPMAVTDFHPMQSLAPKTTEWIKHVVERKAPIQDCCSVGMDELELKALKRQDDQRGNTVAGWRSTSSSLHLFQYISLTGRQRSLH